jgi:hypothetical protein
VIDLDPEEVEMGRLSPFVIEVGGARSGRSFDSPHPALP